MSSRNILLNAIGPQDKYLRDTISVTANARNIGLE